MRKYPSTRLATPYPIFSPLSFSNISYITTTIVSSTSPTTMTKSKYHHPRSSHQPLPPHNPSTNSSPGHLATHLIEHHPIIQKLHLNISIPEGKLVPMPNNRLTYLEWVRELLIGRRNNINTRRRDTEHATDSTPPHEDTILKQQQQQQEAAVSPPTTTTSASHEKQNNTTPASQQIHAIDIGTGSSAIYPLLANRKFNWKFTCTECDPESYHSACENVYQRNQMNKDQISIHLVKQDDPLLECIRDSEIRYDCTVCNPPFFESEQHANASKNPLKIRPGSASELWCPGGEFKFLTRLVNESLILKDKVALYTSWVGRKSTLKRLRQYLYTKRITIQYHTEFMEGNQYRWGIAWVVPANYEESAQSLKDQAAIFAAPVPSDSPAANEVHVRHVATHRRMRHNTPTSLKILHTALKQEVYKLKDEKQIEQLSEDKYTGVIQFVIPKQEKSQKLSHTNKKKLEELTTQPVKVLIEFKSISPKNTLCQIQSADFHTQAYQLVYDRLCSVIKGLK